MKTNDKDFDKLLKRVISLKDNLFGVGNWSKNLLPTDSEGCLSYIRYCETQYGMIG